MDLFFIIFLSIVGGSVCTYVLLTFMQKERKNFTSEEFKNIKSSIDEILEIAEDEKKNRLISKGEKQEQYTNQMSLIKEFQKNANELTPPAIGGDPAERGRCREASGHGRLRRRIKQLGEERVPRPHEGMVADGLDRVDDRHLREIAAGEARHHRSSQGTTTDLHKQSIEVLWRRVIVSGKSRDHLERKCATAVNPCWGVGPLAREGRGATLDRVDHGVVGWIAEAAYLSLDSVDHRTGQLDLCDHGIVGPGRHEHVELVLSSSGHDRCGQGRIAT